MDWQKAFPRNFLTLWLLDPRWRDFGILPADVAVAVVASRLLTLDMPRASLLNVDSEDEVELDVVPDDTGRDTGIILCDCRRIKSWNSTSSSAKRLWLRRKA